MHSNISNLIKLINDKFFNIPISSKIASLLKMSNTSTNITQPKFKGRVQRTSYKASEKLVVIDKAKKFGILATARQLGIDQSMVSQWVRDEKKFSDAISTN